MTWQRNVEDSGTLVNGRRYNEDNTIEKMFESDDLEEVGRCQWNGDMLQNISVWQKIVEDVGTIVNGRSP